MTLQKPYNLSIRDKIIDGKSSYKLSWQVSGDTSASFSISIYNNATGALTWSLSRTYSYALSYTIPANSFPNGADYKISVTVWNSSNQSATSQFVVFTATSKPVVTVPTIGTVGNHAYLFTATYSQAENSPLKSYTMNLYDSDKDLIKTSGTKTDGLLEHRFDLMKNNTDYYFEVIVRSKVGLSTSSGLIKFTVIYENPAMYFDLTAENIAEKASVKLNWTVKQVIGKTNVKPVYVNGTEIDVRSGKVFYDEGFQISKDFTLKIWLRNKVVDKNLIYLTGTNGSIRLVYEADNRFHLYKVVNGFNYHYSSNVITGTTFYICVQQITGKMNLIVEKVN